MMRCDKTGLTDKDFKTILDVLNVYDPNDIIDHIPSMGSAEFMQDVQSAFKAVLAHVNRGKYNSDLGAFAGDPKRHADDLDEQDYAEADKQRHREDRVKEIEALAYQQYIHSLS
jgi:hypothetical protein